MKTANDIAVDHGLWGTVTMAALDVALAEGRRAGLEEAAKQARAVALDLLEDGNKQGQYQVTRLADSLMEQSRRGL